MLSSGWCLANADRTLSLHDLVLSLSQGDSQWRAGRRSERVKGDQGAAALTRATKPPLMHRSCHHSKVCVPCVIAPPARSAAAISVVSASSGSLAPAFL